MQERASKPELIAALEEHHRLLDLQCRLARRFAQSVPCGFESWIVDIRAELRQMRDLLVDHFKQEEAGRLHEEIAEALPNATLRLRLLIDQHAEILGCIEGLLDCAVSCATAVEGPPLCVTASEFFALLDQHERAERELFLLAIEGEGGAPDA